MSDYPVNPTDTTSPVNEFKPTQGLTFSDRLARCTYDGPFEIVYLFTDPVTGSTFSVRQGEALGEALARFIRGCGVSRRKDDRKP